MRFDDREQAGRLLAGKLRRFEAEHPIVLGLTRGGIPVAFQVAHVLGAPLDIIVVRKIDATGPEAPGSPELAIGAIAEGGETFLNPTVVHEAGMRAEDTSAYAEWGAVELARQVRLYRDRRPPLPLSGRTVIVVDDGVTTGASARAAGRAARQRGAARVVLAAPIVAGSAEPQLRSEFDEVVALEIPPEARELAEFYQCFDEVGDDAALELLRRAEGESPAEWPAP
jgi:putative phosphoribosyl transferase